MKNKLYLYLIQCNSSDFYKIGFSENPENRLRNLQVGCPYSLTLVYKKCFKKSAKAERFLHKKYRYKRGIGEWFELSRDDIVQIKNEIELIPYGQTINNPLPNYIPMLNKIRATDNLPPLEL